MKYLSEQELKVGYEELDILPRWGYLDSEWCDLVLESDYRQDDRMFIKIPPELNMLEAYMNGDYDEICNDTKE